jgi:hypothetical protein
MLENPSARAALGVGRMRQPQHTVHVFQRGIQACNEAVVVVDIHDLALAGRWAGRSRTQLTLELIELRWKPRIVREWSTPNLYMGEHTRGVLGFTAYS